MELDLNGSNSFYSLSWFIMVLDSNWAKVIFFFKIRSMVFSILVILVFRFC